MTSQTAKTTIYMSPYNHSDVGLYDGAANWTVYTPGELSQSLAGLAANSNFDLFAWYDGTNVVLKLSSAWASNTARTDALTQQNGAWVNNAAIGSMGAKKGLYLGTFRTTGTTGQCEDSDNKRFVWSYYNQVLTACLTWDTTDSWTTTSSTWAAMNGGNSAWKHEFVCGMNEMPVRTELLATVADRAAMAFAVDGTDLDRVKTGIMWTNSLALAQVMSILAYLGLGYHYVQALQATFQGGYVATWFGDNTAVFGSGTTPANSGMNSLWMR